MPIQEKYLFVVSMDVAPEKEELFNEVYDTEHLPAFRAVPGVRSATRFVMEPTTVVVDGETRTFTIEGEPKYTAIYEITGPEVLLSDEWIAAGEVGRWNSEVRPFTTNRRHVVRRVIEG
jgi:hypothetical protein